MDRTVDLLTLVLRAYIDTSLGTMVGVVVGLFVVALCQSAATPTALERAQRVWRRSGVQP